MIECKNSEGDFIFFLGKNRMIQVKASQMMPPANVFTTTTTRMIAKTTITIIKNRTPGKLKIKTHTIIIITIAVSANIRS